MADGDIHVMPIGDLVDHQVSDNCLCGPDSELIRGADGSDTWLIIHHALDGREHKEPDHDKQACSLCADTNPAAMG